MKQKNIRVWKHATADESAHYFCKLQYGGKRVSFDLGTNIEADAEKKAKEIYHHLRGSGVTETLKKYKPEALKEPQGPPMTVGAFLDAFGRNFNVKRTTVTSYAQDLRRAVCDLAGLPRLQTNHAEQNALILPKIDAQPLSILTRAKLHAWRQAYLAECAPDPVSQGRARIRSNQVLNHIAAMFSPERQEVLGLSMENPATKIKRLPEPECKFVPKVDIEELFSKAMRVLDTERKKAFVLLLCAGLRRAEADGLTWNQIIWDANKVRIEDTKYFKLKVATARGDVPIDEEIMGLLKGRYAQPDRDPIFVLTGGPVRHDQKRAYYRANLTFDKLINWLRLNRVSDQKPLHYLRKACGSLINEKGGIYQAQQMLRHSKLETTVKHYVEKGCKVTVGLSISGQSKVVEASDEFKKTA